MLITNVTNEYVNNAASNDNNDIDNNGEDSNE